MNSAIRATRPSARDLTIADIAGRLAPVFERYGTALAVVFGSVARGEATRRSDVDLIVVRHTEARFLDRYIGIQHDLCEALDGVPVEPLIYTPDEFERMRSVPLVRDALAEGRIIYECA